MDGAKDGRWIDDGTHNVGAKLQKNFVFRKKIRIFATEFDFYVRKLNEEKARNDPSPSWYAGCNIVY